MSPGLNFFFFNFEYIIRDLAIQSRCDIRDNLLLMLCLARSSFYAQSSIIYLTIAAEIDHGSIPSAGLENRGGDPAVFTRSDSLPCAMCWPITMISRLASLRSNSGPGGSSVRNFGLRSFTPNDHSPFTHAGRSTWPHGCVAAIFMLNTLIFRP
jgi:hypothetical protein